MKKVKMFNKDFEELEKKIDNLIRKGRYSEIGKVIIEGYGNLSIQNMNILLNLCNKYHEERSKFIVDYIRLLDKIMDEVKLEPKEYSQLILPFFNLVYEGVYIRTINLLLIYLLVKDEDFEEVLKKYQLDGDEIFYLLTAVEDRRMKAYHKLKDAKKLLSDKINDKEIGKILLFEANKIRNKIAHFDFIVTSEGSLIIDEEKITLEKIFELIYSMFEVSVILTRLIKLSCVFKFLNETTDASRKELEKRGVDIETMGKEELIKIIKEIRSNIRKNL